MEMQCEEWLLQTTKLMVIYTRPIISPNCYVPFLSEWTIENKLLIGFIFLLAYWQRYRRYQFVYV